MKAFLYRLLQLTWGLPQSLVGFIVFLTQIKKPHYTYRGAVVTNWHGHGGSVSLGMFLFIDIAHDRPETPYEKDLLLHEYGHTIQSLFLGPLFLLVIGLPSFVWATCFSAYRKRKKRSYYAFYPEKWANHLGAKYRK